MIEIWLADFHFYYKKEGGTFIVRDVITKRIPTRFILNEGLAYDRATKDFDSMKTFVGTLQDDPATGRKKFTIKFTKKIGEANERI